MSIYATPGTLPPDPAPLPGTERSESRAARAERFRLLLRSPSVVIGAIVILFWIFCALFPRLVAPYDPIFDNNFPTSQPPTWGHPFGTDTNGRDVFSRVLAGSRDVLLIAPAATLLGVVLGTMLGLITGYLRGVVDDVVSRFVDAVLSLPLIVTAILIVTAVGKSSTWVIAFIIGLIFAPVVSRTVRAAVLVEADLDYVQAARLRGERSIYIMNSEILPNVMAPVVVELTVRLGYAIFAVATLGFLGFGVQPPNPAWAARDQPVLDAHRPLLVDDAVPRARDREPCRRRQPRGRRRARGVRAMSTEQGNVLEVEDLELVYRVRGIDRPVLRGVSFAIERGGSYGLVGESGCGKSTAALGIVRYLPRNGRVSGGKVTVAGRDVYGLSSRGLREYHAQTVSMVYQNPGSALNPSLRIGTQVAEAFTVLGVPAKEAMERAREALVQGPDRRPRERPRPLPASALRRHAAARRDRDGAREGARAADPRRADDGPRRDRRGRGARSRRRACSPSSTRPCSSSATTSG